MNILTDEEGHRAVNGCKTGTTREILRAVEAAVLEKLGKVEVEPVVYSARRRNRYTGEFSSWREVEAEFEAIVQTESIPDEWEIRKLYPASALAALQQEVWLLTSTEELLIKQSEKLVEQRDALHVENEMMKQEHIQRLLRIEEKVEVLIAERDTLRTQLAQAQEHLSFIERWAVHHGTKPHMTPEEALSVIQHYPPINAITKGYADGKTPDTPNPWEQLAQAQADAARYQYLKENHSYHYSMQPDSPAEHGIEYQWQQGSYEERYQGLDDSIDAAIDASMKVMEDEC